MEPSSEGDVLMLAEPRTLSFENRRIICGSTPTDEATSTILRLYNQSDKRVFEVPCPRCAAFFEIAWKDIRWPEGRPEDAHCVCPHCDGAIEEREKAHMVEAGAWRATAPEVKNHAGFRINALVSPLANAAWPKLVEEFLRAKDDTNLLKTFVTTLLAEPWKELGEANRKPLNHAVRSR
jgi:phage terminase large subunit GpA-like protein